jgi:hypothetical protein
MGLRHEVSYFVSYVHVIRLKRWRQINILDPVDRKESFKLSPGPHVAAFETPWAQSIVHTWKVFH